VSIPQVHSWRCQLDLERDSWMNHCGTRVLHWGQLQENCEKRHVSRSKKEHKHLKLFQLMSQWWLTSKKAQENDKKRSN
jgi:hypothetical protein